MNRRREFLAECGKRNDVIHMGVGLKIGFNSEVSSPDKISDCIRVVARINDSGPPVSCPDDKTVRLEFPYNNRFNIHGTSAYAGGCVSPRRKC